MKDEIRQSILKEWIKLPSPELASLMEITWQAREPEIKEAYKDGIKDVIGEVNGHRMLAGDIVIRKHEWEYIQKGFGL